MAALIRYSEDSKPEDRTIKLDIDLCDHQGNICIQMRGFTSRILEGESRPAYKETVHNSAHHKSNLVEDVPCFDSAFYQKLITDVLNRDVSVDEAVEWN